jgi:hypothetical protein
VIAQKSDTSGFRCMGHGLQLGTDSYASRWQRPAKTDPRGGQGPERKFTILAPSASTVKQYASLRAWLEDWR